VSRTYSYNYDIGHINNMYLIVELIKDVDQTDFGYTIIELFSLHKVYIQAETSVCTF